MNSIIKDIATGLYAGLMVILKLSLQINELLMFMSLLLGVILLLMRIYSSYLYIKKQRK